MYRLTARVLGIVVALLAVVGFFVEGEHLMGFANVDIALDIVRAVLAALLLWAGFGNAPISAQRAVIGVVGALYIVMGVLAFFDRELFGMLPTGFTDFDIAFHLIVGVAAVIIASIPTDRSQKQGRAVSSAPLP